MPISIERARRIAIEGSPQFIYYNSQITAGSSQIWDFEIGTSGYSYAEKKYTPFNSLAISNTSNCLIEVEFGASKTVVPANSTVTVTETAFNRVKITNKDSSNTISANSVILKVQVAPLNEDEAIRRKEWGVLLPFRSIYR